MIAFWNYSDGSLLYVLLCLYVCIEIFYTGYDGLKLQFSARRKKRIVKEVIERIKNKAA